jgi:predicted Zn-dependent protease
MIKLLHTTVFLVSLLLSNSVMAQQAPSPAEDRGSSPSVAAIQQDTPALHRIADAQQQIAADPKKVQAYNELAIAFLRRTRESADAKYLNDAEGALAQGLKLNADDFQLQRTEASLMLSRHQFAQARERAMALQRRNPDDIFTYGVIAEADLGLGNYPEAESKAQWMMNLRPNNTPALIIGAKLRILFGDNHGAIDFLYRAYSQTSPDEVEDLAWIANQIASIQFESGQTDAAAKTLDQAEQLFPHYPTTLENLASVRMAQNRASDAVQLWMQAASMDHDPHVLYELARAQQAAGDSNAAHATESPAACCARASS